MKVNQVIRRIIPWIEEHSLTAAKQKTEIVMITRKHVNTIVPVRVDDTLTQTKDNLKYLGVSVDNKLNFWSHIGRVADKTTDVTKSLSRLMGKVKGVVKRRLPLSTTLSILQLGAEILAGAKRMLSKKIRQDTDGSTSGHVALLHSIRRGGASDRWNRSY